MAFAYGGIFLLSLLLPVAYFTLVRKTQSEPWLFVLFLCVSLVNFGYLLISVSNTVSFALFANKIAYLGQVIVPMCMLMLISGLCGIRIKREVTISLIICATLMFAMVCTTGYLPWYYESAELAEAAGGAYLVKQYGFLHPTNLVYVIAYSIAMLTITIYSLRGHKGDGQKLAGLMLVVVLGNIGMWVLEKLIPTHFELLAISYLMSACVFLFVYLVLQDYIRKSELPRTEVVLSVGVDDPVALQAVLDKLAPTSPLTAKELEVLELLLSGLSRKEIAAKLHVSENTAKTHTAHIYEKLEVSGKDGLLAKLHSAR